MRDHDDGECFEVRFERLQKRVDAHAFWLIGLLLAGYFVLAALFIKGVLTWKDFPIGLLARDG